MSIRDRINDHGDVVPALRQGIPGADGNTILYGTAAPTTEGVNGDFYIRTATNYLYGPKAGGVWPAGVSLVGSPVSDTAYNATTWNGVTDVAPSKDAVRDAVELTRTAGIVSSIRQSASGLTTNGSTALVIPDLPLTVDASATRIWASGIYSLLNDGGFWTLTVSGVIKFDASYAGSDPSKVTWTPQNGATGTPVFALIFPTGDFMGQWCKVTGTIPHSWWQWDGALSPAWQPRFTDEGQPIAYNPILTSYRKLTISGADGSETLEISAL